MSSILSRLYQVKSILTASRHIPWVKIPKPGPNTVILYQRPPPWWAKWAHGLLAVDVMMMTSIVEYTWDLGGFLRPTPQTPSPEQAANESEPLPFQVAQNLQERPVWKKTLFSGFYVISGIIFGAALLASRARLLRSVTVQKANPRTKTPPKVFLQAASHAREHAIAFPSTACSLVQGDMPSRLFLRVQGQGAWTMILPGADIHRGDPSSKIAETPRTAMLRAWRDVGGFIEPVAK